MQFQTCKSAVRPPRKTQGSCSPLMKVSFHPFENPEEIIKTLVAEANLPTQSPLTPKLRQNHILRLPSLIAGYYTYLRWTIHTTKRK